MDIPGAPPLETVFENLRPGDHRESSDATPNYNCIAWAAGSVSEWWWPTRFCHWPSGVERSTNLVSAIAAFRTLGFSICPDGSLDPDSEKIALFARDEVLTHAARQLPSGTWTSKLGRRIDIEHRTLECLEGDAYGRVAAFMSRRL
jgi:hypothetical protein